MRLRDVVAILTFVLGVGGGLYWRATRQQHTGFTVSGGAGEAIRECPVGSYFTDDPKTGKFECVRAAVPFYGSGALDPPVSCGGPDDSFREGDYYLDTSTGTTYQCLRTAPAWTVIPECSDGKRLTREGKIVDCKPKP